MPTSLRSRAEEPRASTRFVPVSLILLALAGCSESKSRPKPSAGVQTSAVTNSPSGTIASSTEPSVNGTGCPKGSAHVTREGNTVTVTFDRFAAEVSPKAKFAVKDCNVVIPTAGDKRVSLASFTLDGELALEKGASTRLTFDNYIQGTPDEARSAQRLVEGPSEEPLKLERTVDPDQRLWSECGAPRSLNSLARVRVLAGSEDEDAGVVVEPGKGKVKSAKLTLVLDEQPCSGS